MSLVAGMLLEKHDFGNIHLHADAGFCSPDVDLI